MKYYPGNDPPRWWITLLRKLIAKRKDQAFS